MYQVMVDYYDTRMGVWYSQEFKTGEEARLTYAIESGRLYKGGIRGVYLMKSGVIVAKSMHEKEEDNA